MPVEAVASMAARHAGTFTQNPRPYTPKSWTVDPKTLDPGRQPRPGAVLRREHDSAARRRHRRLV
jgi:hypothetical protein